MLQNHDNITSVPLSPPTDDDNEKVKIVSVQLDDEESTVQFINVQNFEVSSPQQCLLQGSTYAWLCAASFN